jgi:hypothetical protein
MFLEYDSCAMADDLIAFQDQMHEAQRALTALDEVTKRDDLASIVKAVVQGKITCEHLQRHQKSVRMSAEESHQIQTAIDLIKARLKFLDENV